MIFFMKETEISRYNFQYLVHPALAVLNATTRRDVLSISPRHVYRGMPIHSP